MCVGSDMVCVGCDMLCVGWDGRYGMVWEFVGCESCDDCVWDVTCCAAWDARCDAM